MATGVVAAGCVREAIGVVVAEGATMGVIAASVRTTWSWPVDLLVR
jgi:hypothetical protein